ncbi:MAG: FHA domain-containing protein [Steroidobacteraceae bacterium]
MAVQKLPSHPSDEDLEATAELPVVDFADVPDGDVAALSDSVLATDVFPAPLLPAGVADLADSLRDVEQRLQRKIDRVAQLEADLGDAGHQIGDLRQQLEHTQRTGAEREATLRADLAAAGQRAADLQREQSVLQNSLAEIRTQLQAQREALGESQVQAEQRASVQRHNERDLLELRRRSAQQLEVLSTWQGFRAVTESMLSERDEQLRTIDARHSAELHAVRAQAAQLQSDLSFARDESAARIAALEESLRSAGLTQQASAAALGAAAEQAARLNAQLAERDASIADLQKQLHALRAVEEKARLGAASYDEQQQQIARLQTALSATNDRLHESTEQARLAAERQRRLEAEAHASAALLGNLQQNMARLGSDDTGARLALRPPVDAVRMLIREEGGAEVTYQLGRRTTIGRTPENDIQLDTSFISRHHAVLLSNTDHCIVEDLNSTNGVLVNGRRVGRQILYDGDTLTVGRTEFRYQQRS